MFTGWHGRAWLPPGCKTALTYFLWQGWAVTQEDRVCFVWLRRHLSLSYLSASIFSRLSPQSTNFLSSLSAPTNALSSSLGLSAFPPSILSSVHCHTGIKQRSCWAVYLLLGCRVLLLVNEVIRRHSDLTKGICSACCILFTPPSSISLYKYEPLMEWPDAGIINMSLYQRTN